MVKNPDYWKPGRPFLDGIEYTIIKNQSTGVLSFVAGQVDMTSPYFLQVPMIKDIGRRRRRPPARWCRRTCSATSSSTDRRRPFDNPEMRRAVALTVDRKAFIDTLTQGNGDIGGALLAPPEGIWGMPRDLMEQLPGYNPDVEKSRAEARKIMQTHGYGPNKRL